MLSVLKVIVTDISSYEPYTSRESCFRNPSIHEWSTPAADAFKHRISSFDEPRHLIYVCFSWEQTSET